MRQRRRSTLVLLGEDVVRDDRDRGDGLRALQSERGDTLLNPRLDRQGAALLGVERRRGQTRRFDLIIVIA